MPYALIRQAILQRRSLSAEYEGLQRRFSPHALGRNRAGSPAVVVFQYAGAAPAGLPLAGDWACFQLDGLRNLTVNDDVWLAGPIAGRPSGWLESIDVSV
ncbi:MAG TPA: hypothetical protein VEC14_10740 [Reyranellaceae bacterium]|nr:hypothetical protein [Reyranellaceae bacterium]